MCLRKVGVKSKFYQGFLVQNILVWQTSVTFLLPDSFLLVPLHSVKHLRKLLLMLFPVLTAEQLLPAFPFPLHSPDCQPTHPGRLGSSSLIALAQLLGFSLVHFVLERQESAAGTFVM